MLAAALVVLTILAALAFTDDANGHRPAPAACTTAWHAAPDGERLAAKQACEARQARHRIAHETAPCQTIGRATVKHARASSHQRQMLTRALNESRRHRASRHVQVALVAGLTQESSATNPAGGDRDSAGPLQIRSMHGSLEQRRSVEWSTRRFLVSGFTGAGGAKAIARRHPAWRPGHVTQAVQGSGHPHAYHQWEREARRTVATFLSRCPA